MGTRLSIAAPDDLSLPRDANSYGYIRLAPDRWDADRQCLCTVLDLDNGPVRLDVAQQERGRLRAIADRALLRSEQSSVRAAMTRMLRLDETEDDIAAFHAIDPRWKTSGRGRLFRSSSLLMDMVRTVTSCNIAWSGTVLMNERFCAVLGRGGAFPSALRLARTRPGTLRSRCRVGYRDTRLIELAKLFTRGEIDEAWMTDPVTPDDAVFAFLKTLPGFGPYAAANMMQLLGRYGFLAIDSEAVRHGKQTLGLTGSEREIVSQLRARYEPFGAHKFRSYWFELWEAYEKVHGPGHLWKPATPRAKASAR